MKQQADKERGRVTVKRRFLFSGFLLPPILQLLERIHAIASSLNANPTTAQVSLQERTALFHKPWLARQ
jgi:hypothetical protein